MNKAITYGDIEHMVARFGFISKPVDTKNIVYYHKGADALFVLPSNRSNDPVRPSHMAIVRRTIIESGIAEAPEIDSALEAEPAAA